MTTITDTTQATDARRDVEQLRRKAAAFRSFGAVHEADALTATADELETRLETWTEAQTREAGAAVMDELREIVRTARQNEQIYIDTMTTLVKLQAEMPRALDRFHELRRIAVLGSQDVSALGGAAEGTDPGQSRSVSARGRFLCHPPAVGRSGRSRQFGETTPSCDRACPDGDAIVSPELYDALAALSKLREAIVDELNASDQAALDALMADVWARTPEGAGGEAFRIETASATVAHELGTRIAAGDPQAARLFAVVSVEGLVALMDEEEAHGGPIRSVDDLLDRLELRCGPEAQA